MPRLVRFFWIAFLALIPQISSAQAGSTPQVANSNAIYQQLKNVALGSEAVTLNDVRLKRDGGLFMFKSGTLYFLAPVNGKVTGAVFGGDGSFVLETSQPSEQKNIALLTKENSVQENFHTAVFRFTDNSYEELKKLGTSTTSAAGNAAEALATVNDTLRKSKVIRYNLAGHMLADVLNERPVAGMFYAFISGLRYSDKEIFALDPQGVTMFEVQPEEVVFATYDDKGANTIQQAYAPSIWYSAHLQSEIDAGKARGTQFNAAYDVEKQKLDLTVEKSGMISATAITTFKSKKTGLRAVSFNLFRNFKIQNVTDESGQPLDFVYEEGSYNRMDRDDPENLTVILPKALNEGEPFTIKTVYGGKEAVTNEGGGNYYPVARDNWFPAARMGDSADYDMTFSIPKGMKMAATGMLVNEKADGDHAITEWKSYAPMWMAGFIFGKFKIQEAKLTNGSTVRAYANENLPDWVNSLQHAAEDDREVVLGTMDSTTMMKGPLSEGQAALSIYSNYFGAMPYNTLQLTQQTACTFGQAWPGLVWLPICSFYDSTVRHQLGLDDTGEAYWSVVTPHEVAHEWWGQTVGWSSYRDQWMSEGFAEFSASLFTQAVYSKDPAKFTRFWTDRQRNMQQKNQFGYRYSDVGPLALGWRLNNMRSGFGTYRHVIYPKGAYVLHMIRMMMFDPAKGGDTAFGAMMQDFVKTYKNRPASTEDFKGIVERHMTVTMDVDKNQKMDWFFNEWVYGTEIPRYTFAYDLQETPEGWVATIKPGQDGVSSNFVMPVPIYVEMASGKITKLGSANLRGVVNTDFKVNLGKGPKPKRLMLNYYNDILQQIQ